MPPFVGLDEDQHAKRAAAVAHGDFNPRHRLAGSYGGVVEVPADLVLAAEPVCETRGVTDQFNCRPITDLRNGMVTVTSTASAYNPIFYAMVGLAGRPFNGTQSLYAMRACAEILCALMIALAAAITSRWASTRAPLVALQLAAAPVLWYSASILAPNGLEMCCALVMWAALLGIVRRQGDADRLTVVAGTVAACLLAAVRGLGPFWLVLIAMAVLVITPHETLRAVKAARWARTSALAIAACVAYAVAWTLAASATSVTPPVANPGSSIAAAFRGLPLWALGTFAMFPGRTETAPVAVYTIGVAVWILFLAIAIGRARTTIRISAAFIVLAAALIPFALTVVTYHRIG
ncbi:MAG TPA: DUF2142 domain-containing protein, partial [Thermomicrobiales bacterium]|nr:DUF2142 domain-containing protein [Thermomicrobiales bacterium]